jgi:hypothetical protein
MLTLNILRYKDNLYLTIKILLNLIIYFGYDYSYIYEHFNNINYNNINLIILTTTILSVIHTSFICSQLFQNKHYTNIHLNINKITVHNLYSQIFGTVILYYITGYFQFNIVTWSITIIMIEILILTSFIIAFTAKLINIICGLLKFILRIILYTTYLTLACITKLIFGIE